jgi:hypothetical protein
MPWPQTGVFAAVLFQPQSVSAGAADRHHLIGPEDASNAKSDCPVSIVGVNHDSQHVSISMGSQQKKFAP